MTTEKRGFAPIAAATETALVYERDLVARNQRPSSVHTVIHATTGERSGDAAPGRFPGRKDRDRLFYAEAFHRLSGVTQVMSPSLYSTRTHNRLTHSMKVAQVARSIAESLLRRSHSDISLRQRILELGGLDADVAEAAALAHDIGHPPFGHIGENVLDHVARMGITRSDLVGEW